MTTVKEAAESAKVALVPVAPARSPNLQQRMLAVMAAIGYIPKEGYGPEAQGSYRFARAEHIKDAVRDACVEHGVMVHVSMDGREVQVITGEKRTVILATVWGTLTFVNVDEPAERETVAIHGQGIDSQDKAISKATTSALKYGLLNAFTIPTGDDPDAEGQDVPAQPGTAQVRTVPSGPPPQAQPGGRCPKHDRAWTHGRYGWYCTAKDDSEERGYCKQKPTAEWAAAHER